MENDSGNDILGTANAILIAVVVAVIALVSWRASVIDDAAGDADYAGLRSAVYTVRAEALNAVNAYESYGSYVNYLRNKRQGELFEARLETAPEEEQPLLTEQIKIANDLADANSDLFPNRFLNRDGSYSISRQMGVMWSDAAREFDMDYAGKFAEADKGRASTRNMLASVMVLSIATVFYALMESVEGKTRLLMVILGSLTAAAGMVMAALVWFGVW